MVSDLFMQAEAVWDGCRWQGNAHQTAGITELITMFTGRDARKGAVYDRTENERNAANKLVWMLESELYKGENPSGCYACNGWKSEKESLQSMQIPCKRGNCISVSDYVWNDPENVFTGWYQSTGIIFYFLCHIWKKCRVCTEISSQGNADCNRRSYQYRSYKDKDGKTIYTTDVIVEEHEFAQNKENGAGADLSEKPKIDKDGFMEAPDGEIQFD